MLYFIIIYIYLHFVSANVDINKLTRKYFSKIIYTNLNFIEKFAFINKVRIFAQLL